MNKISIERTVQPLTNQIYFLPKKGPAPEKAYLFTTNGYTWVLEGWENAKNWNNKFHPGANGIEIILNPRYK